MISKIETIDGGLVALTRFTGEIAFEVGGLKRIIDKYLEWGGFQENSHRKVSIPIIIEECLKVGVNKKDVKFICSNGLH